MLNKLVIEEAKRLYESPSANFNQVSFYDKLNNCFQGKAAEMYLVENKDMQFLDEATIDLLVKHKYYKDIKKNLIYHDLVKDGKVIEVKAFSKDNIDYSVEKALKTIRNRTYNFSDYLIVFTFDNWKYELYKKIKV